MSADKFRIAASTALCLFAQAAFSQIPLQGVDPWFALNQVGACLIEAKGGDPSDPGDRENCTANDFRITQIDIIAVTDQCADPEDYMQVTLDVIFAKAQPLRYDPAVWFYRGDDTEGTPSPAFPDQDAQNGELCTRFTAANPLGAGPTAFLTDLDGDACLDAAGTAGPLPNVTFTDIILPCRDGDNTLNPVLAPNGIVDIHGCTTWRNNTQGICSGPEYDGATEPDPGTTSKCNCGNFEGVTIQIGLPDLGVDKSCVGVGGADLDDLKPGDQVDCTVTITNSGLGNADGSSGPTDPGFFWRDDYPDQFSYVSPIIAGPSNNNTGQAVLPVVYPNNLNPGEVVFFPDQIMGTITSGGPNGTASVTYRLELNSGFPESGSIENTVCTFYGNGSTVISYEDEAGQCDSVTFTPITLSSFLAERDPYTGELVFDWSTSTESGNLGFNLYAVAGKALLPVNDVMIPSEVIDSRSLTKYQARFADPTDGIAQRFYIEDVDRLGNTTRHGPFHLDKPSGVTDPEADVVLTDWKKFKAKKDQKDKERGKSFAAKLKGNSKSGQKGKKNGGSETLLASSTLTGSGLAVRVMVDESGIQRVTADDLAALGIAPGSVSADAIGLTRDGAPVPVNVHDTGGFGPGSYIEFVGEALSNLYTDSAVYLLDLGGAAGVALTTQNASPKGKKYAEYYMHTERRSENTGYNFSSPYPTEPWYDTRQLAINSPSTAGFELPASEIAADSGGIATVSARIAGGVSFADDPSDHHVYLYFQGQSVAEEWFDGMTARTLSADVPLSQLGAGNLVETYVPADTVNELDLIYVESIELTYPRRFVATGDRLSFTADVNNFSVSGFSTDDIVVYAESGGGTVLLENTDIKASGGGYSVSFAGVEGIARYHASTAGAIATPDLDTYEARSLDGLVADHLVITHPSLLGPEFDDYLAARGALADGITEVVSVYDIYEAFSGGVVDGEAIGGFVRDVASRSDLGSVLFIGGDTYDYKGYLNGDSFSLVPTIYRPTDDFVKFSAVDALFGDIDGDLVPDVPVGRVPVRSVDELATAAAKLGQYNAGLGANTAVLAADNTEPTDAYNFSGISNVVADPLEQDGWNVTRAYLDDMSVADAKAALIDGINQGSRLTVYTGHSNSTQWTYDGLFRTSDAAALENHGDPTAIIQWGCWNTYFVDPAQDSLGHVLMLSGDQGAATVVGASTLTNAGAEKELAELLHNAIVQDGATLGEAMIGAKRAYAAEYGAGDVDILWGVSILGDPLIRVK